MLISFNMIWERPKVWIDVCRIRLCIRNWIVETSLAFTFLGSNYVTFSFFFFKCVPNNSSVIVIIWYNKITCQTISLIIQTTNWVASENEVTDKHIEWLRLKWDRQYKNVPKSKASNSFNQSLGRLFRIELMKRQHAWEFEECGPPELFRLMCFFIPSNRWTLNERDILHKLSIEQ